MGLCAQGEHCLLEKACVHSTQAKLPSNMGVFRVL